MKVLPVPERQLMKQLAVRVHFYDVVVFSTTGLSRASYVWSSCITKMKGKGKSTSNIDRSSSQRLRPQKDGTHEFSTILPDQRDNRVSEARGWSPKKRALNQKDIESSVKKIKKIKGDSISEVPCSVADVSKSRRHSSVAILPILESPQMEKSFLNVNKTLNTSVKRSQRHKKSTPKKEVLYAKSAKQSLIKKNIDIVDLSSDSSSEKLPADEEVSRSESDSSAKERQMDESQELTNIINSNFRTFLDFISSELMEGNTAIPKEASAQEKLPCKTTRITPTLIKGVRQEKSPSKPEKSPVTTVVTNEEAVKESHGDALDIRESSPFLSDPRNKIASKRREWTTEIRNEEGKLQRKPSDSKKKIHVSKTGTGQFQFKKQPCTFYGSDTIEVLESIEIPERESVLEEPSMKRKRPRVTVEHFEPEESPSEPEQSPIKKGRTTRKLAGLHQNKSYSKVKPSRSGDNNEEGPLRIKPTVKMSQKHAYQSRSKPLQVEYDSSETSPVKRKSSIATNHNNHFEPEASVTESETSPKKNDPSDWGSTHSFKAKEPL
ncbi:hypothetical protein TNCV_1034751 [Trichonephila clavipes]|nr:hypothetical protein TNCV_1034751 [Trichonephila clavipes]